MTISGNKGICAAVVLAALCLPGSGSQAANKGRIEVQFNAAPEKASRPLPVILSELSNLNDYSLFANGGWDGNWYVGFNVCWIEELPAAPPGNYRRALIGVRLGREKSRNVVGKPIWEKEPIPGEIYVSLASTPSWKPSQKYFLTDAVDIPLEGDPENAVEGTGESRWFWTEVPLSAVNSEGPNYVAVWSPKEYFVSTASSPILAGGWGGKKINSWLNNDVRGFAPLNPQNALKTPISVFEPAIALKLIPEGTEQDLLVSVEDIKAGRENTANRTIVAAVGGEEIEKVWLESSSEGEHWTKHGGFLYSPPYLLTFRPAASAAGTLKVRVAAVDIWGNAGYSAPAEISTDK